MMAADVRERNISCCRTRPSHNQGSLDSQSWINGRGGPSLPQHPLWWSMQTWNQITSCVIERKTKVVCLCRTWLFQRCKYKKSKYAALQLSFDGYCIDLQVTCCHLFVASNKIASDTRWRSVGRLITWKKRQIYRGMILQLNGGRVEQDEGDEHKVLGDSFDYDGYYFYTVTIFMDNTSSLEAVVRTYWVSCCLQPEYNIASTTSK